MLVWNKKQRETDIETNMFNIRTSEHEQTNNIVFFLNPNIIHTVKMF